MMRINNIGESGSLCRSPLWWAIESTGTPLRRILVEDVASSPLIISHHIGPKPNFFSTSSRKAQDIESKVFEMSYLKRMRGLLLLVKKIDSLLNKHEVVLDEALLNAS
jgi:hypothetical protein